MWSAVSHGESSMCSHLLLDSISLVKLVWEQRRTFFWVRMQPLRNNKSKNGDLQQSECAPLMVYHILGFFKTSVYAWLEVPQIRKDPFFESVSQPMQSIVILTFSHFLRAERKLRT
jgi:hypothetical protein